MTTTNKAQPTEASADFRLERETIRDWSPVVSCLMWCAAKHGFVPWLVDDGGDDRQLVTGGTVQGRRLVAVDLVVAVDESEVIFLHQPSGRRVSVLVVLGNEPEELVADHSENAEWDLVVEDFCEVWEGKRCPIAYRWRRRYLTGGAL